MTTFNDLLGLIGLEAISMIIVLALTGVVLVLLMKDGEE